MSRALEREDLTIIDHLNSAAAKITERQNVSLNGKREYAIALTHIEDAVMRVNRGVAMDTGQFNPADVERTHG